MSSRFSPDARREYWRRQALKQPVETRCAFCGFTVTGPVVETREVFAAHDCPGMPERRNSPTMRLQ